MRVNRSSAAQVGLGGRRPGTCSGTSTKGNNVAASGTLSIVLSYCRRSDVAYPHKVVGGQGEGKIPVHPGQSAVSHYSRHPHRLQPAEDLLNTFSQMLAHLVCEMPSRTTIDGAVAELPGHV